MTARPEIDFFGLVRLKKSRGCGWIVGRPRKRLRNGKPGIEMANISYYASPSDALYAALTRLVSHRGTLRSIGVPGELLGASAAVSASEAAYVLTRLPELVCTLRESRGWTRKDLAVRAGVDRRTVWAVENRRSGYSVDLGLKLLDALGEG